MQSSAQLSSVHSERVLCLQAAVPDVKVDSDVAMVDTKPEADAKPEAPMIEAPAADGVQSSSAPEACHHVNVVMLPACPSLYGMRS